MILPEIKGSRMNSYSISEFKGLNKNKNKIGEGQFEELINMSSDQYPAMSVRQKRKTVINNMDEILGICAASNEIYYVARKDGEVNLYKNEEKIETGPKLEDSKKEMQLMGAYLIILPDRVMYNTSKNTDNRSDYREWVKLHYELNIAQENGVYMYLSDENGWRYITVPILGSGWEGTLVNGDTIQERDKLLKNVLETNMNIKRSAGTVPEFVNKKTIEYAKGESLEIEPLHIISGDKNTLATYSEKTTYGLYFGGIDDEGKIYIEKYTEDLGLWSPIELYVTYWIHTIHAADIKENIKQGDYIKLQSQDEAGRDIVEGKDDDPKWKFIKYFNSYVKVEKVLYKEESPNQIGLVFSAQGSDFLEVLRNTSNYFTYGTYACEIQSGKVETKKSVNKLNTVIPFGSSAAGNIAPKVKLMKDMPEMDYVTVSKNRLWGCSSQKHEIYASKLGDPTNWHTYAGIASDSYAVTIGSPGEFTGAYTYDDCPTFFKNDRIINFYGTRPSNYQLNEISCDGVEPDGNKTIANVSGLLFYKARKGVMRYDGNYPVYVSAELGDEYIKGIAAGGVDSKYYISVREKNNEKAIYVFDNDTRMWFREENTDINDFLNADGNLYAVDGNKIVYIYGKSDIQLDIKEEESVVEYEAVTGEILQGISTKGIVGKIYVTFELEKNAGIEMLINYDNSKTWERILHKKSSERKTYYIPVIPRRCQKLRLKFRGRGNCNINQITIMTKVSGGII